MVGRDSRPGDQMAIASVGAYWCESRPKVTRRKGPLAVNFFNISVAEVMLLSYIKPCSVGVMNLIAPVAQGIDWKNTSSRNYCHSTIKYLVEGIEVLY
jgi:hypothetical protein